MQDCKILLIRSNEVGWTDLRGALRSLEGAHIVGDATSAELARRLATTHIPDVILSALAVAGEPALPLLRDLRGECCPDSKIVLFSARFDPDDLAALVALGVAGYLLWSDLTCETLRYCLEAVIAGDILVGSGVVGRTFIETQCGALFPHEAPVRLTARERAVLSRLAEGPTQKETAATEGVSATTVKRTVAKLEAKLDAPTQVVLGKRAAQLGLLR